MRNPIEPLFVFLFIFISFSLSAFSEDASLKWNESSHYLSNDIEINADFNLLTLDDCCEEVGGKPAELTFKFVGGGCAADNNSQESKSNCSGGVPGSGPYSFSASDKDNNVFQSGTVSAGTIFTIRNGGNNLPNPTFININNGQEEIEVHTSCSAPLVPGERFGSLELLSLLTDDGEQCGDPCPDPGIKSEAIQCIEDQAIFSLTNPDFSVNYFWTFGEGSSPSSFSGINPPSISYSSVGLKTITILQDGSCPVSVNINVGECECPDPVIDFDLACAGIPVTFSTEDLGEGFIYEWNFGTGAVPSSASGKGPHSVTYGFTGSASVTVDVERECEDQIVPTNCCDEFGAKTKSITFKYVGGGCAADNNSQGSKSGCSGNANNASPTNIKLYEGSTTYFNGTVSLGETFTATASNEFRANTDFMINNQETGFFHTSCSQPLGIGDQFGSLLIIGMTSNDGEVCG